MPVIVVANPKGGVGKSTLATNMAGYLAAQGHAVMLGDADRQQSSRHWLALRPPACRRSRPGRSSHGDVVRPPKGTTHVVLDTPAGPARQASRRGDALADKVLIPLQPSLFDIQATHAFIDDAARPPAQRPRCSSAWSACACAKHTIANDQLHQFLDSCSVPVLAFLRDTQNYVHLAARGLTLWDVAPSRVERDLEQWEPIITGELKPMKHFVRNTAAELQPRGRRRASPSATGSRSTRSGSTCSPTPPATTSGSTSTPSARSRARSARRSRTAF